MFTKKVSFFISRVWSNCLYMYINKWTKISYGLLVIANILREFHLLPQNSAHFMEKIDET